MCGAFCHTLAAFRNRNDAIHARSFFARDFFSGVDRAVLMGSFLKSGVPTTYRDQLPATSSYELLLKIASGGMATVYVGRFSGAAAVQNQRKIDSRRGNFR